MNLKVIDSKNRKRQPPYFRISYGYGFISKLLYELLGKPNYIRLAIDEEERVIGIAPCSKDDYGSVKCTVSKSGQITFSSARATKIIRGLTKDSSKPYTFYLEGKEGDYHIAHIDKGVCI